MNRTKLDGGWKIKSDIVGINKLTNSSAADGRIRSFLLWRCRMGHCCDGGWYWWSVVARGGRDEFFSAAAEDVGFGHGGRGGGE